MTDPAPLSKLHPSAGLVMSRPRADECVTTRTEDLRAASRVLEFVADEDHQWIVMCALFQPTQAARYDINGHRMYGRPGA